MKLKDLLPIVSENTRFKLRDIYTGETLEEYNGKDSLSGKYDTCKIFSIYGTGEGIVCYIYPENALTESEKERRNVLVNDLLSFSL